jgi:hypothetical protein
VGTTAPPPPRLNTDPSLDPIEDPTLKAFVSPAGDRKIILQWDNSSELRSDPITGENLFEGYRVWRVDNWQRPEGSIGPSPDEWMKLAEFRESENANSQGARPLREITQRDIKEIGFTDDEVPLAIFPVGRYRYEDTNGIINGKVYFYSVTAFGVLEREDPNDPTRTQIVELGGQPSAVEAEMVLPRWDSVAGCDQVKVVPNPYRGRASWDLIPSDRDPTGTKLAFRNLPDEECTIKIYTLAGDLVKQATHDGSDSDGTYFWDMITRNGQNVTSGIYLYSVETKDDVCRGRFVIIR